MFGNDAFLLEGYLSQEQIDELEHKIEESTSHEIILVVDSNGGAFFDVLRLCQNLQKMKESGKKVTVLINKRAIGPSAFVPFVADSLYIAPLSVWGNIPYGLDNTVPQDVMIDAARGLIPPGKDEKTKEQIAESMVDPYAQVAGSQLNSDPLLLSTEQVVSLGYAREVDSLNEFLANENAVIVQNGFASIAHDQIKDVMTEKEFAGSIESHVHFDQSSENYIGYIQLHSSISRASFLQTKFAIKHFQKLGAKLIVLDLNAEKGDIFAAINITDLLERTDANDGIPVLAYINTKALSSVALIPFACRYIIVRSDSILGAVPQERFERMYSALKPEFARAASFWGRNQKLAEAMVEREDVLVLRNHEVTTLKSDDQIVVGGPDPDVVLTSSGELLTLKGNLIYDLGIASQMVEEQSTITKEEFSAGTWPAEHSAVFSLPVLKDVRDATMISYKSTSVLFFSLLTNPILLALLFFGLLVGFYLELNTPGFGIMGTIGLVCFALIIWGNATVHSIHWVQWSLLAVGLAFFAIELFFIPGFGWTGVTGITFILVALASFSFPTTGGLDLLQWDAFTLVFSYVLPQFLWIVGGLVAGAVAIYIVARFFSGRVLNLSKLKLHNTVTSPQGYTRPNPDIEMPEIGALGEAYTSLRPSGQVRIGDEIYDAVTQTGFIDKETPVTVVRINGYKLVVRQIGEEE